MKDLFVTLVVAALCLGLAHSLQCYSCKAALNDGACMTIQNCSSSEQRCQTTVANIIFVTLITKGCAATCMSGYQQMVISNVTEGCCDTDLCNNKTIGNNNSNNFNFNFNFGNAASSVRVSLLVPAALLAVVGVLVNLDF